MGKLTVCDFAGNSRVYLAERLAGPNMMIVAARASVGLISMENVMSLMNRHFLITAAFGAATVVGLAISSSVVRAGDVKSGLKPGDEPQAFLVQDATGPAAGEGKLCYRCRYGSNPVVAVFTRKLDDSVASLVKQVDAQVEKNKEKRMKAFLVFLTDDPDKAESKLKAIAEKNHIKNVPLTIFDGPLGPLDYKLSEKADVTVLMWVKSDVKVNYAFSQGGLDKKSITAIVRDTSKILN